MTLTIRPLTDRTEVDAAFSVFLRAMVGLPLRDIDAGEVTEWGRYLGALDDGAVVGGADSYTSSLVVPGGARLPHAAVTHVGVLPTHRRRGIVTGLMSRQLRDVAERGEVVASLRASEAGIYERFGYGVATSSQSARVHTGRSVLRAGLPSGGTVRLVDGAVTTDLLRGIYDRVDRVGSIERPTGWWAFRERIRSLDGTPTYVVVHSTDAVDDGYAIYQPQDTAGWFTSRERSVRVSDFVASTDAARAGLWRHLLSLDLVDVVEFEALALDDPLPLAVVDRRSVESGPPRDETWLRLIDVEAALRARQRGADDPVTLRVHDDLLESNDATFEIGSKQVLRTDAPAEASVDVATLAAAYLGGTSWQSLASVGRVVAARPATIVRLDNLFGTASAPFAGTVF